MNTKLVKKVAEAIFAELGKSREFYISATKFLSPERRLRPSAPSWKATRCAG